MHSGLHRQSVFCLINSKLLLYGIKINKILDIKILAEGQVRSMEFNDKEFSKYEYGINDFSDINEEFFEDIEKERNKARLDYLAISARALSVNACANYDLLNSSVEWCREWSVCSECGRVVYAGEILVISKKMDRDSNRLQKVHRCDSCGERAIKLGNKFDEEVESNEIKHWLDDYLGGY